jgi:uncharacterized protein YerC
MREISRAKRLEVAHYYLLGYSYGEIEAETGVSHGSIANIVRELENSKRNLVLHLATEDPDPIVDDIMKLGYDVEVRRH